MDRFICVLTESEVRDGWLSPSGEFHPIEGVQTHAGWVIDDCHKREEGEPSILDITPNELWDIADANGIDKTDESWNARAILYKRWARIKYVRFEDLVYVNSVGLTKEQRAWLEDLHYETGMAVKMDNGTRRSREKVLFNARPSTR